MSLRNPFVTSAGGILKSRESLLNWRLSKHGSALIQTLNMKGLDMIKTVTDFIATLADRLTCPAALYGHLAGTHGYAAYVTGKPEVYVPMMGLYLLLALRAGH